jgi:cytochrome c biogenesis protein CcmG, thiol:disulfide interchange protein DsbE
MSRVGEKGRVAAAICLAAIVLSAGAGCGGSDGADAGSGNPDSALTQEDAQAPVENAPKELAGLREEANEVLEEGPDGFDARLAELKSAGIPVVINKWASWCGPCREEFPYFQRQAIERGDEVAFLGLLSNDGKETGETFLSELPLPYPSYLDSDGEIASRLGIQREFPTTIFIDSEGEVAHTKYGPYADLESASAEEQLIADIERYAQ